MWDKVPTVQGSPVPEGKDKDVQETHCSPDLADKQHDIGDATFHNTQFSRIASS